MQDTRTRYTHFSYAFLVHFEVYSSPLPSVWCKVTYALCTCRSSRIILLSFRKTSTQVGSLVNGDWRIIDNWQETVWLIQLKIIVIFSHKHISCLYQHKSDSDNMCIKVIIINIIVEFIRGKIFLHTIIVSLYNYKYQTCLYSSAKSTWLFAKWRGTFRFNLTKFTSMRVQTTLASIICA